MTWDPIKVFLEQKHEYSKRRGAAAGTSLLRGKPIPFTTWLDVRMFGRKFLAETKGHPIDATEGWKNTWATAMAQAYGGEGVSGSFLDSVGNWKASFPHARLIMRDGPFAGTAEYSRIFSSDRCRNEVYPWNEAFWAYGQRFAIARSAIGSLPGNWKMLRDTFVDAFSALLPDIPGFPKMPDFTKMMVYGGIGYVAYLGLKAKKGKK